jgi:putative oxidoreductase
MLRNDVSRWRIFIAARASVTIHPIASPVTRSPKESDMSSNRRIDAAAVVLRTAVGIMFIAHAGLKYFVFTLPGTAQFFVSLGLPGALGYVTFAAELIGGVLLVSGIGTRIVALALTPVLLGATWAHAGNGWVFNAPNGGWEYPAFLTLATLVTGLLGNGSKDEITVGRAITPRLAAAR